MTDVPTAAQPTPPDRLASLDVLRALAVLLVLGRHVLDPVTNLPESVSMVLRAWRSFGWFGVDLFFVLSGFLVSGLLFNEYRRYGSVRALRFFGRRGFKIYPGFYVLMAVTWFWMGSKLPTKLFVYEALFVQNYLGIIWNHTWSLAVEEHFYAGLALLVWLVCRKATSPDPFRWLPAFTVALALVVLGLRVVAFSNNPQGDLLMPTHLRIDALMFGVALCYGWTWHKEKLERFVEKYGRSVLIVSLGLLMPSVLRPLEGDGVVNTIGLTTNYLGFGGLVLLAVTRRSIPNALKPLAWLGYYSYSIYLWHMPMWLWARMLFEKRAGHGAAVTAYFVGSLIFGVVAALVIELPMLRVRERLLPSRTAHVR